MGRRNNPRSYRRPQKSKSKKRDYSPFPVNEMKDKHFEKGDRDGGFDNWIPIDTHNIPVDKSKLLNTSNMNVLIPKEKTDKERY